MPVSARRRGATSTGTVVLVPNVRIELEILFEKGCGGFFLVPETAGHIHAIDLDRLAT